MRPFFPASRLARALPHLSRLVGLTCSEKLSVTVKLLSTREAQVHGATLSSSKPLFLSVDEDQIAGSERRHTTEQVSYAVFSGPVVYP